MEAFKITDDTSRSIFIDYLKERGHLVAVSSIVKNSHNLIVNGNSAYFVFRSGNGVQTVDLNLDVSNYPILKQVQEQAKGRKIIISEHLRVLFTDAVRSRDLRITGLRYEFCRFNLENREMSRRFSLGWKRNVGWTLQSSIPIELGTAVLVAEVIKIPNREDKVKTMFLAARPLDCCHFGMTYVPKLSK